MILFPQKHPDRLAYLALTAVCLFWGTTYLGIRIALEGFPPFYLIAVRYVISGSILLTVAALAGVTLPAGRELLLTMLCGVTGIGVGSGLLALGETWVPSGLAALFYTTGPFFMVGIDALLPRGKKPLLKTIGGLLVGLLGVGFLVFPTIVREGFSGRTITGFVILQVSVGMWVLGSLLQKRVRSHALPFVTGAVQQLAAGVAMFLPAALFEKMPHHLPPRPLLAVLYLVVFGSIVGYSAFIYSMVHLPVAIVSIYTFVNPVVAVFLGWLFFREQFGYRECIAMLIIFAGIVQVRRAERQSARANMPEPISVPD